MKTGSLIIILVVVLVSCNKEEVQDIDCEKFYTASLTVDEKTLKDEIEKLTVDLSPAPIPEDPLGQMSNLKVLVDRLNENCDNYTASINCYACIETFPAQSEILLEFTDGHNIIIDLHTSEKDILRFAGAHPQ